MFIKGLLCTITILGGWNTATDKIKAPLLGGRDILEGELGRKQDHGAIACHL